MAERRKPGEDDSALWRTVTRDVKPIKRGKPAAAAPPAPPKPPKAKATTKRTRPAAAMPAGAMAPRPPPRPAELTHGRAHGVDKRTLDRLRRGQMAIEAEIDLHGHTQEQAHAALRAFIAGQANAGRRCVRVVTGRGLAREGGGVLKTAVPRWLNEAGMREQVLAFSHARPDDGGDGALYVLLRRKRPKPIPGR